MPIVARGFSGKQRTAAADGPVTLVTAVRDPEHSHVPVLLSVLRSD